MRRALVLGGVLLAACGESSGETGVDLAIRWDAALGLDRLALTVTAGGESLVERTLLPEEDRPLSESGREAVVVLLPDRLGGDEVSLVVDGLARAEVVATGQVAVALSPGELVTAAIALRPIGEEGCEDWDFAPSNLVPCEAPAPEGALILDRPGTYTIDTATGRIATPDGDSLEPASDLAAQAGGPMVRRIAVDSLVIEAGTAVEVSGPHALVVAVWGEATIAGTIDLAGGSGKDGPGGGGAPCATGGGTGGGDAGEAGSGAGGGGGGANGGDGGDGGDGHGDEKGAKGAKGREAGEPGLVPLAGGCPGGAGGDAYGSPGSGAPGGGAGGALEIAAQVGIVVSGTIRVAGGAGGGGAAASTSGAGGGGGGSGGAILLEAIDIELSGAARLCANGGSGGEGGLAGDAGASGSAGTCTGERATTANQTDGGGDGGRGTAGDARAGENAKAGSGSGAGGGGGGGTGRIRVRAPGQLTDHGALFTPETE